MRILLATVAMFVTMTANAEPIIPDEATKIKALKLGYILNGNSMVGKNASSTDLTGVDLSGDVNQIANDILQTIGETPRPVKIERVVPDPAPDAIWPVLPKKQVVAEEDTCTRHGMHKVYYHKTWKCKK